MTFIKNELYSNTENWILINGEVYAINYTVNLSQLFEFLDIKSTALITEYNQVILKTDFSKNIFLNPFDQIEFVTIVGGG
uniref:Thiamine biosynthesis protein n=1 Tax=Nannochloropsis oculata TaxID=43925 RepID=T1RHT2_9STRA|nr:thiamine biosynthesis protein [Nannochloropsis oculata]AGI99070.1 thiamine biosynthesis protein [Nannochloropsis oculata]AHX25358.1 thiamine biosynthesis protein S [Nannochloropsis oculata]